MRHILVLDDDKFVIEYFKSLVEKLPFRTEIRGVRTFESAIKAIEEKNYDLYILDYDLGKEKTGLDFYLQYLMSGDSKVIIHSNSHPEVLGELRAMFRQKPLGLEMLKEIVS